MRHALTWIALLALASCVTKPIAQSANSPQIAELNHAFATVDAETATAIRDSQYLRRFANLDIRTVTGTQSTWTGRYLYGRQTYIEFFAPEDFHINGSPAPVGSFGIAFSGDRRGTNDVLAKRLEISGQKALREIETRKFGDRTVPWFEALTAITKHGDSGALGETVSVWAMEYVPSYFDVPDAGKEPSEGLHDLISRERYQSDVYATRMMRDIVEVVYEIDRKDFARIEPLLWAAGYRVDRSANSVFLKGGEANLRFILSSTGRQGLRQVRFALNAPFARHVEVIGRSTLTVGPDATASWTFPAH